jgi:hypothetical protein
LNDPWSIIPKTFAIFQGYRASWLGTHCLISPFFLNCPYRAFCSRQQNKIKLAVFSRRHAHTQSISFWTWFNAGLTRGWTVAIDRNRVRGSSPMPQRNQERPSIGWRLYWHPKGSRKDSTVQFASEAPDTRQYHLTISSRMQFVFVFVRSLDLTRAGKDSTTADAACFSSFLTLMCTVCLSGG